ncbi:MAG: ATP-binding cassette domain-containing protein, partial [Chloroflexi bacterium]|nr:ATP-binding cassette domain-containing protein [Chloroflexota bacterium]
MSILTASNVGHSFGAFDLFSNISVSIPKDGKVGLVGPNGIGKTTLLLILAGLNKPTAGSVHRARGTRLGYLPQEATQAFAGQAHSVYEEMLALFADLRREEARLRQMEADMAAGNASDELMEKYGAALEQFELAGGYDYELRIQQVLDGLGFGQENWGLPLNHLSGGQKTRTLLARLLLEKPDLLILDEPTNHLDVAAVEWLEQTLKMWDGAILLVSHDRYFLDRVANTIWEMGRNTIESYRGNYSAYLGQRQERWEQRRQVFAAEKERLEKELDYIRRNIAGQRTQAAKGKLSRISRELDAIQRGGGLEAIQGKSWAEVSGELLPSRHTMSVAEAAQAIKSLQRPDGVHRTFQVRLKASRRSGNIVLRTKNLTVGYPGRPLFTAEDIELHRGQRPAERPTRREPKPCPGRGDPRRGAPHRQVERRQERRVDRRFGMAGQELETRGERQRRRSRASARQPLDREEHPGHERQRAAHRVEGEADQHPGQRIDDRGQERRRLREAEGARKRARAHPGRHQPQPRQQHPAGLERQRSEQQMERKQGSARAVAP